MTTSGTSKPTSCSLPKAPASEASLDPEEAEPGDSRGLLELLHTGDLSDVDVVVGEKIFRCHKAILGAKSPFFKVALLLLVTHLSSMYLHFNIFWMTIKVLSARVFSLDQTSNANSGLITYPF